MNSEVQPIRVALKALCLFVVINVLYAMIDPQISGISLYNSIFPGRARMPFGEDAYTVMIDDIDVMIASHEIAASKMPDEYRVALIGDSSIWGEHLPVRDTLSGQWNASGVKCGDRSIHFYNLGYPHPSVVKDLIVLDAALEHEPDLIVWFVTLNTLTPRRLNPFMVANRERAGALLGTYDIPFQHESALLEDKPSFYEKTLIGRKSYLARFVKLQMLGAIWAATDADKALLPKRKSPPLPDVKAKTRFKGKKPGSNLKKLMLFSALEAGHDIAGSIPILIVNEPIYIATGRNSDVRYNDGYPRWAYDQYRKAIANAAQKAGWNYLDLWDAIPKEHFASKSLYLSPKGEALLMERIDPVMQDMACK